jgi:hypothetical protein
VTRLVILASKRPAEIVAVQFPFGDQLAFGETISGQAVTVSVFAGVDPAPAAMLFGAASQSAGIVTQQIQGGLPGVIYQLVCAVSTSMANVLTKGARQAVASDPGAFTGPV